MKFPKLDEWIQAARVRITKKNGKRVLEVQRVVKKKKRKPAKKRKTPLLKNVRRSVKRQESEARWQYYGSQHGKRLDKRIASGKKLSLRQMRSQGR